MCHVMDDAALLGGEESSIDTKDLCQCLELCNQ